MNVVFQQVSLGFCLCASYGLCVSGLFVGWLNLICVCGCGCGCDYLPHHAIQSRMLMVNDLMIDQTRRQRFTSMVLELVAMLLSDDALLSSHHNG